MSAQLSHPYCAVVTILEGAAFVEQFTEEKIRDSKLLDLAREVEVIGDLEIDKLGRPLRYTVYIDVYLKDGKKYSITETYPKGHPKNPFTLEELHGKFKNLAGRVFHDEIKLNKIIKTIENLEELKDVRVLRDLLSKRDGCQS